MKKYFLLFTFVAVSYGLQAQYFPAGGYQGGTHGNVVVDLYIIEFIVENQAGNPILNAVITVGEQSNPEGEYLFKDLEAGVYDYHVSAPGYEDASGSVLIDDDDVVLLVVLTALPDHFLDLLDIGIGAGMVECFYAAMVITLAGEGHFFIAEAGSSTTLIAGERIRLLPGTHIKHAAYFHAYIGTDICPPALPSVIAGKETSMQNKNMVMDRTEALFFKVYPNPTEGVFTLELLIHSDTETMLVEVHSLLGGRIIRSELPVQGAHSLDLTGHQPGLYIIRVMKGDKVGVERLIKR